MITRLVWLCVVLALVSTMARAGYGFAQACAPNVGSANFESNGYRGSALASTSQLNIFAEDAQHNRIRATSKIVNCKAQFDHLMVNRPDGTQISFSVTNATPALIEQYASSIALADQLLDAGYAAIQGHTKTQTAAAGPRSSGSPASGSPASGSPASGSPASGSPAVQTTGSKDSQASAGLSLVQPGPGSKPEHATIALGMDNTSMGNALGAAMAQANSDPTGRNTANVISCEMYNMNCEFVEQGQWSSPALKQEAEQHALMFWSKIMTNCGDDSYYYAGSGLDNIAFFGQPLEYRYDFDILKFSNVKVYVYAPTPTVLTPADIENGKKLPDNEATTVLEALTFRKGDRRSQLWGPSQLGPLAHVMDFSTGIQPYPKAAHLEDTVNVSGKIQVHMEKRNGIWYYSLENSNIARSEDNLLDASSLPYSPLWNGEVKRLAGARVSPPSCDEIKDFVNQESPEYAARKQAAEKARTDAIKAKIDEVSFTGTLSDFHNQLPAFEQRAMSARRLDEAAYKQEFALIDKIIKACAAPTPSVRPSDMARGGSFEARMAAGRAGGPVQCPDQSVDVTAMSHASHADPRIGLHVLKSRAPGTTSFHMDIGFLYGASTLFATDNKIVAAAVQ